MVAVAVIGYILAASFWSDRRTVKAEYAAYTQKMSAAAREAALQRLKDEADKADEILVLNDRIEALKLPAVRIEPVEVVHLAKKIKAAKK